MLHRLAASATATVAATIALVTGLACSAAAPQSAELATKWKDATVHDIKVKTIDGKDANLSEYAGKVTLVVNVASQCGFTGQYAGLQKLYDKYKDQGFVVLAFPSGDFGGQEFDTSAEIKEFCSTRYNVTFPVFEKCQVKAGAAKSGAAGAGQSPVFEALGTKTGELPGWNFGKYLVSRDGKSAQFFPSTVAPESARMVEALEKELAKAFDKGAADKTAANTGAAKTGAADKAGAPKTDPAPADAGKAAPAGK